LAKRKSSYQLLAFSFQLSAFSFQLSARSVPGKKLRAGLAALPAPAVAGIVDRNETHLSNLPGITSGSDGRAELFLHIEWQRDNRRIN
jgi:hypothetical protein